MIIFLRILILLFMATIWAFIYVGFIEKYVFRFWMFLDKKIFFYKYKRGKACEGVDFHTCGQYVECRYNDCEKLGCRAKTPI